MPHIPSYHIYPVCSALLDISLITLHRVESYSSVQLQLKKLFLREAFTHDIYHHFVIAVIGFTSLSDHSLDKGQECLSLLHIVSVISNIAPGTWYILKDI